MLQLRATGHGDMRVAFNAQCGSSSCSGSKFVANSDWAKPRRPTRQYSQHDSIGAAALSVTVPHGQNAPLAVVPTPAFPQCQLANDLWANGVVAYFDGQQHGFWAEGLSDFDASLEADPGHADRLYFAATLHSIQGHYIEAERGYEAAIAVGPGRPEAYVELVSFLEAHHRQDDARRVARSAILAGAQWANEMQRPPLFFRSLTSRSWWDPSRFPWGAELEAEFPNLKAELDAFLVAKGNKQKLETGVPVGWPKVGENRSAHAGDREIVSPGGDWRECVLFQPGHHGPLDPDVVQCLSKTRRLLETLLPGAVEMAKLGVGEIILSALAPGTRLAPHCASSNVRLTCHLGMICPEGARIRVGEEWRTWKEGECLFFDDSYEHEIVHAGSSMRIVLLIRFWHPDLPQSQRMPILHAGVELNQAMERKRFKPPMNEAVAKNVAERMPRIRSIMAQ